MASATPTFHSTKETTNYARLCRLLVDVGSQVLREAFNKKRPPGNLDTVFSSPPVHALLQSLQKKRVLNPSQWGKLYPATRSSVSSKNFDITLLMVLLRNICGLVPPASGWDKLPLATDITLEADIVRIKCYRNTLYGHANEASVGDATFNQYWGDIQAALIRLGGAFYQGAIDDLKKECIDPECEEHYQKLLKQWVNDEVSIKERLGQIEEKLDELKESVVNPEKKARVEVIGYTSALKESIKSQTEFQTKFTHFPIISRVKTDDIFTNLLIQQGRKPFEDLNVGRDERLRQYGQVSGSRVQHCQDIFILDADHDEESNPKTILLTGKAGIGKTLFCQKLIRDWACGNLFQAKTNAQISDFKFAYLLTFRQLNLLGNHCFTLREILNRSSVLDEHSNIDNSLFEYILNHSEEVLIVIDGYDEYSQQDSIADGTDEQYPNSAQEKMPVAALCAKLIKGKIMRGSAVMITSRPDESDKISGDEIQFDRFVEITGFSEQQVNEYIRKYFSQNENMKNIVLDHVTKNEELVSFAHIPVLCFLMCCYFEYILKKSAINAEASALPVKISNLYCEVVNSFFLKHDKKRGFSPKDTLDKLSELAARLLLEKTFLFAEEDMNKFSSQEIEYLRTSGLLNCGPPFRKSFSQTTKYFCFTHLTIQEYLAARWFVKMRKFPPRQGLSAMVMQFMAGLLSAEKDDEFMEEFLGSLGESSVDDKSIPLLIAKCLAEYQDKEFAKNIVKKRYRQFCDLNGGIRFQRLTDVDCFAVSYLLDIISSLKEEEPVGRHHAFSEQSFNARNLTIIYSHLTKSGVKQICKSLSNKLCPITELVLRASQLNDECADCIVELGLVNKLTVLKLIGNKITDAGVASLCRALQAATSTVTTLHLGDNQITANGVESLCQALETATCKMTTLDVSVNWIKDAGVVGLCQALQTSTCKVTILDLGDNQITNTGVAYLCQALKTAACKVTTIHLGGNQITDAGVLSLCEALQATACEITTLDLSFNPITYAGVVSLCQALQAPTCNITILRLRANQITDASVISLCQALETSTCRVTTLQLSSNHITDAGVVSLCQVLQTATCKVTTLDLSYNQITDDGVSSFCQALRLPTCKVKSLLLRNNRITDVGFECLRNLLQEKPALDVVF